jgi:hypothetical protein
VEVSKQLFIGIKVSRALQTELDSPAPGTQQYLERGTPDYLEFVTMGDDKIIGRYLQGGCTADQVEIVGRNVCSTVRIVTRGYRIAEESVLIYAC